MSGPTRRVFLGAAAAGLAVGPRRARALRGRGRRPNIVFINLDQAHWGTLGVHGERWVKTPNIDRLAVAGTDFHLSFASDPACSPSRAAWMTGRPGSENGVMLNGLRLREGLPDIGAWLRERAGYESCHVGKWHILGRPVNRAFEVLHEGSLLGEHGDLATALSAVGWLRNRKPGQPFLLMVGLLNPHDTCHWLGMARDREEVPDPGLAREEVTPLPENMRVPRVEPALVKRIKRGWGMRQKWRGWQWRSFLWAYQRQVEMADGVVGLLLDAIAEHPEADNTVVILSGDHGDQLGRQGLTGKSVLYEDAARVPLVLSWPGQWAEGAVDQRRLVSGLDLAPTLCELAGVPPMPGARGLSLVPLVDGRGGIWRSHLVLECSVEGRAVRTPDLKWITYRDDPVEQLFDLSRDPLETHDLGQEPAFEATRAELRRLLDEHAARLEPAPVARLSFDEAMAARTAPALRFDEEG
ncbi:MAG: sulfatase-like hydrolase/transferase [Alphaproteobacteria bacterium]|nr:sulfatase-like hydrolase/transferase [Alphaproteobacteria bacterium]